MTGQVENHTESDSFSNDSTSPYEGRLFGLGRRYYVSADDMHAYWSTYNVYTDSSPEDIDLPNISSNDGSLEKEIVDKWNLDCGSVEQFKLET